MKKDDLELLRDLERCASLGKKTTEVMEEKISDNTMAAQLSRQKLKYSQLHDRAEDILLRENGKTYRENRVEEGMLAGKLHASTLFDVSSTHLAELLIHSSSRELSGVWKAMNHHPQAEGMSQELAKEFLTFEEKNIAGWKKYL